MFAPFSSASSFSSLASDVSSLLAILFCGVVLWRATSLALRLLDVKLGAAIGRLILPSDEVLRDIVARLRLRQRIRAQVGLRRRRRLRRPVGRGV